MKKLLVSDFDETFFFKDKSLAENIYYVNKWTLKNLFVIATGRSYMDYYNKAKDIKTNYLIINHGATILKNNQVIYNIPIGNDVVNKINKDLLLEQKEIFCCSEKESRVDINSKDITKIHIYCNNLKKSEELMKYLTNNYPVNCYLITGGKSIEVVSNKVNKAKAIFKIMEQENINIDNVYTIGNGYTDIDMIKEFKGFSITGSVNELTKYSNKNYNSVADLIKELL